MHTTDQLSTTTKECRQCLIPWVRLLLTVVISSSSRYSEKGKSYAHSRVYLLNFGLLLNQTTSTIFFCHSQL